MKPFPILEVRGLSVDFHTGDGVVHAVRETTFDVDRGEIVALVGETGCGKSVIAHAIMGLLPAEARVSGSVRFGGRDLFTLDEREMEKIRGSEIAIILQNPTLSLNPVYPVGDQIAEPLVVHRNTPLPAARRRAAEILKRMGFCDPKPVMSLYPSQCSGGMNQRFLVAASTILESPLLIADEPTKGMDADRVEDVVADIQRLVRGNGTALLLITHDLEVARKIADRIAVMYAGEIVEIGDAGQVLDKPRHPYTRGLLRSLPENGFVPIPGISPSPLQIPPGCVFHPRCSHRMERCVHGHPELATDGDRGVRCYRCP
jgi:peptide/nickel transport system ATP-binding protein